MRVLIVGCGYVGVSLGAELVRQGHEVFGLRRSPDAEQQLKTAGIAPVYADISNRESLNALPLPFDWVVNTVSSGRAGGLDEYRQAYFEGTRNLIDWLGSNPPKKFVYTSSTSVYAQSDGSLVKEDSSATPDSPTSQVLVETEQLLLNAFKENRFPSIVLRVAGIYGPGRGHAFQQYLRNEARIVGKGDRLLNMVHLDDVTGAVIAALKSGRAGEIYNVVDDEPVAEIHFFRWLSETVGKYMPPFISEAEAPDRKRGATNKKVSNRRLKMELGYRFKHPTFRQGYTAEIQRLDRAGELNIMPDPR
jgi:nucleoside-diphosphate-sugar epimerase